MHVKYSKAGFLSIIDNYHFKGNSQDRSTIPTYHYTFSLTGNVLLWSCTEKQSCLRLNKHRKGDHSNQYFFQCRIFGVYLDLLIDKLLKDAVIEPFCSNWSSWKSFDEMCSIINIYWYSDTESKSYNSLQTPQSQKVDYCTDVDTAPCPQPRLLSHI